MLVHQDPAAECPAPDVELTIAMAPQETAMCGACGGVLRQDPDTAAPEDE
jgi:hypothetical protein